jgi:hypothetical protein
MANPLTNRTNEILSTERVVEVGGPLEVRERLTPVDTDAGLVAMVVDGNGDVRIDPEAGSFPEEELPEVTDEDLSSIASAEEERGAEEDETRLNDEEDEQVMSADQLRAQERLAQLPRALGLLASVGFSTEPQQVYALNRPEFSVVKPDAPDDEIIAAAKRVLEGQKAEDEAVKDPRIGS